MKNLNSIRIKLFILTVTVALFLASQFTSPSANENELSNTTTFPVPDSQFIIGAFHNGTDLYYDFQDSLRLNTWHYYTAPTDMGWPGTTDDNYNGDVSVYGPGIISRIYNNSYKGMRTLMDRPIIEYLVGGQRIDYECEQIDSNYTINNRYWFYAYRHSLNNNINIYDITDNDPRYGSGEKVKHCLTTPQSILDGYVIIDSNLRSNREMSFIGTNGWLRDTTYEWYVLPKIRIDSAYAADYSHFDDDVCRIVFTGWEGNVEAEFNLKVSSFRKNISTLYNGNYMESYYIDSSGTLDYFLIPKSKLINFTDTTKSVFDWSDTCLCDIKIYWSGKCDMWIDRVRIENRPAHEYLTLKDTIWVNKVNSEVEWATTNNSKPNYIYFEECQMSHFPAIKALNEQITTYPGSNTELVIFLNYDLFKAHIPHNWKYNLYTDFLKKYLYDDYGLRTIVMGSYALEGWAEDELPKQDQYRNSFHPITLWNLPYDADIGILSDTLSPGNYDTWLQEHFDDSVHLSGVNYSYISNLMDSLSRNGMRIINGTQAHLWFKTGHKLKEPSNEELELQANLALTYNAKGLIWFNYVSDRTNIGSSYYCRGVMEYIPHVENPVPRRLNVYEQNKYFKV